MTEEQIELLKQQIKDEIISNLSIEIENYAGDITIRLKYGYETISRDSITIS